MEDFSRHMSKFPLEQEAIRAKCFHPTGTFTEFPKEDVEKSIPERFEKIAKQHPQRVAVKTNTGELTYKALNIEANRVACAILEILGEVVEPVVFFSAQDLRTVICCLAVLKAGKIVVAVDTAYPLERIRRTVDDSQSRILLTGDEDLLLAKDLANGSRKVINTDELGNRSPDKDSVLRISPDGPAEIRYSSGSTGEAKGIVRSHRRLLYSSMSSINSARICPEDRLLVLRNMSFGSRSVLRGLLAGATVLPFDIKGDGLSKLPTLLSKEKITISAMASTTFRCFTHELSESDRFPSMRLIQVSAERLTRLEVNSFKKHFIPDCILLHTLSSGESGNICQYFIDHQTAVNTTVVPAGYPTKEVLILDDTRKALGFNKIGEIAVRSRYLSSEYWGKPDLTGAKFSADPNGGDERIYLTGDIGRILPDGCVVHLGRKDLEVKVRGNRVAISEIESALLGHSQIKDVAVAPWQDKSGDTYLAAYILPAKEQRPKSNELTDFLKKRLPEHMIPTRFVFLDALPTVNGKLDRQSLPEPNNSRPQLAARFVAARTPVEKELATIWCDVLSLDAVGMDDNFFDLGGHSLAAMRVVSRVLRKFQLEVPLQSLFQSPTVASMAVVIAENQNKALGEDALDRMLRELESLSDEEAQRLLAQETKLTSGGERHE